MLRGLKFVVLYINILKKTIKKKWGINQTFQIYVKKPLLSVMIILKPMEKSSLRSFRNPILLQPKSKKLSTRTLLNSLRCSIQERPLPPSSSQSLDHGQRPLEEGCASSLRETSNTLFKRRVSVTKSDPKQENKTVDSMNNSMNQNICLGSSEFQYPLRITWI